MTYFTLRSILQLFSERFRFSERRSIWHFPGSGRRLRLVRIIHAAKNTGFERTHKEAGRGASRHPDPACPPKTGARVRLRKAAIPVVILQCDCIAIARQGCD
jgi:hypothetical protein